MRRNVARALWGVQPKSFNDAEMYLQQRHQQLMNRLRGNMEEAAAENDSIRKQIEGFRSSVSVAHPEHPRGIQTAKAVSVPAQFSVDEPPPPAIRFKKRLFGLNEKQVKNRINELRSAQLNELHRERQELYRLGRERERLLLELSLYQQLLLGEHGTAAAAAVTEEPAKQADIEELQRKWEADRRETLLRELKGKLKQDLLHETKDRWVVEIKEALRQKVLQEHKQLLDEAAPAVDSKRTYAKVTPIHKKLMMSQKAVTLPQKRLTMGGTDFWGEDIEELLAPPVQWVQEQEAVEEFSVTPVIPVMTSIEAEPASAAVEEHAYRLRKKYIVGKICGTDLRDSQGNMIAAKHSVITEEVMNKAEREGKLAELIVNMSFKRIEE